MEKPKTWSQDLANGMVFNIFVFCGWCFFKAKYGSETLEEFAEKICNNTLDAKDQKKLGLYVNKIFFPFLEMQLKKGDHLSEEELQDAWKCYIEFLELVHRGHGKSENSDGSIEKLTAQDIIERCKSRLLDLNEATGYYEESTIEYFCYLSQQVVNELKKSSQN